MLGLVFLSVLSFVASQDYLQDVPGGMTADQIREVILDEINKGRRNVPYGPASNMNHVYWSSIIEKKTMEFARTCPADHGGYIGSSGQNMHWFGWPATEEKLRWCVHWWWNEWYDPGYDYWKSRPVTGRWKDTAHYTIQDGFAVTEVGCGFVNCNGKASTLVCNFDALPRESDVGDFVEKKFLLTNGTERLYEIGPPCTGCRSGTGWCYKGQCVDTCPAGTKGNDCVCGLENQCVNGVLDKEKCQCKCYGDYAGHLCDRPCQNFGYSCNDDSCKDDFIARTECAGYCGQCRCSDHGKCMNGAYDASPEVCGCVCKGGWEGKLCDKCVKEECTKGGTWNDQMCSCDCPDPHRGKTCQLDCTVGDPNNWPCSILQVTMPYVCTNSWYRDQCHARCYPECSAFYLKNCRHMTTIPVCKGGSFNPNTCQCDCINVWQGELCDIPKCSASTLPTAWPCNLFGESWTTSCDNSWFRDQCMYNCNSVCKASYLEKCNGKYTDIPNCVNGEFQRSDCTCKCSEGWGGELCDTARCPGVVGEYPKCSHGTYDYQTCQCVCEDKWQGELCDQAKCTKSTLPTSWPCNLYGDSWIYKCGNSWFSNQCLYNCNPACKASYLENCNGKYTDIPKCVNGEFQRSDCTCKCPDGWKGELCDTATCPGVVGEYPKCSHGTYDYQTCQCVCEDKWQGELCDQAKCTKSTLPTSWPCNLYGDSWITKCGNSWFRNQCLYNCYPACKAKYLEKCIGISDIPACTSGQTFSPTTCKCE